MAELRAIGCRYAQGFYFAPPQDAASLTPLVTNQPAARAPLPRSATSR